MRRYRKVGSSSTIQIFSKQLRLTMKFINQERLRFTKSTRSIVPFLVAGISMSFAGLAQAQVTTYEHCNYTGKKAAVPSGKFTWPNLLRDVPNLKDNDVSSIKVSNGYKATLYADPNYKGRSITVTGDISCLSADKFNETMSSIKVEGPNSEPATNVKSSSSKSSTWNSLLGTRFDDKVITSNIHHKKCLTVNKNKPVGKTYEVIMTKCNQGYGYQKWFSGASRILIKKENLCLQSEDVSGKAVLAAPCKEIKTQNWALTKSGEIKSGSGLCINAVKQLDGYKNGKVITYSCTKEDNQNWRAVTLDSVMKQHEYFDVDDYEIRTSAGAACLEIDEKDPKKGGYNVRTNIKCDRVKNPLWVIDDERIQNYSRDLCLQSSGNNVIAKACDGGFEQNWIMSQKQPYPIKYNPDAHIKSPSGKCFQVFPDPKSIYANVGLRDCNSNVSAQNWKFNKRVLNTSDVKTLGPATVIADTTPDERKYYVLFLCDIRGVSDEETADTLTVKWYDSRREHIDSNKLSGLDCSLTSDAYDIASVSTTHIPGYIDITTDGSDAALITRILTYTDIQGVREADFLKRGRDFMDKDAPMRGHCLSKDPSDASGDWSRRTIGGTCKETVEFTFSDVAWD